VARREDLILNIKHERAVFFSLELKVYIISLNQITRWQVKKIFFFLTNFIRKLATIMKNILPILLLLIGIVSCQTEPQKFFSLKIKGNFKKITTIESRIKYDSLGNEYLDTISVVYTFVDKKQRIKKMVTKVYARNKIAQNIESEYKYIELVI